MFLPAEYYEGDILVDKVLNPCVIDNTGAGLCRHFDYPSIGTFDQAKSASAVTPDGQVPVDYFDDSKVRSVYARVTDERSSNRRLSFSNWTCWACPNCPSSANRNPCCG